MDCDISSPFIYFSNFSIRMCLIKFIVQINMCGIEPSKRITYFASMFSISCSSMVDVFRLSMACVLKFGSAFVLLFFKNFDI